MELLNSFLGQGMVAQIGEIVLFANTVTMAMPTRWRGNMVMDYLSRILNYLAMNSGKNKNMDDILHHWSHWVESSSYWAWDFGGQLIQGNA